MEIVNYVLLAFAAIAAIDRIFGSKLGLGADFEKGLSMAGPLILSMGGMLVLYPVIANWLSGIAGASSVYFDLSIIPALLLANDMGASQLCMALSANDGVGLLNGMVVSSMMGATVSFLIPYVLQLTSKDRHNDAIFGLLCGIITIPVGVAIAGVLIGVDFIPLVFVLLPLLAFAGLLAFGIVKFEKITVKIFIYIGWFIKAVITVGLMIGIVDFVVFSARGVRLFPETTPLWSATAATDVMQPITTILCVMVGALPLLRILEKILSKPLKLLGKKLGTNESSTLGMFVTLGTSITTFEMTSKMDRRGLIFNSAFAVSASFVFIDHLAWTISIAPETTLAVVVGKISAGVAAVAFACFMCKIRGIKKERTDGTADDATLEAAL